MNPSELKPALVRQKVRFKSVLKTKKLQTGQVLCRVDESVLVLCDNDGRPHYFPLEDCEPVPEEPKGFRVGSHVKLEVVGGTFYTKIVSFLLRKDGIKEALLGDGDSVSEKFLRHVTPQEDVEYFN